MINVVALVDAARRTAFKGKLNASQAAGIARIVDAWNAYGNEDDNCLAYVLATSWWETGQRMQPVRETFASTDEQAVKRLETAWQAGKLKWVKTPYWRPDANGVSWFGRGDVQLTHEKNYNGPLRALVLKRFGKSFDIGKRPDLMLDPKVSAYVLIEGMMRRDSLKPDFTAYALEDFVNAQRCEFREARKCVNPADLSSYAPIAAAAKQFQAAIATARAAGAGRMVVYGAPSERDSSVQAVQRRLIDLGYAEVGAPDGIMGRRTQAAILAFRNDNGLPLTTEIDRDLAQALLDAGPRPVPIERAAATAEDIADRPAVKDALSLESIGKWLGIGGGTAAATKGAVETHDVLGMMDRAGEAADRIMPHVSTFQYLLDVAKPMVPFLVIGAIGCVVFYFGRRLVRRAVVGYREGRMF